MTPISQTAKRWVRRLNDWRLAQWQRVCSWASSNQDELGALLGMSIFLFLFGGAICGFIAFLRK